ncbi:ankyrin repeat-containing protein BDA1-like [Quercus suber]|uniref:Ankyrin repeat-containing protein bda1 n=1 Tax=Quercus suber TaxID=58331 RepID=A0AAW0KMC5_QUESU
MEITIQGGDDIVDLYNTLAIGCTTTLKSLIDKDPRILHKIYLTTFGETPLHISALLGHLDFTKTLITQNPCLAVELDSHKRCPLHLASSEGHIEIVQEPLTIYEDACLFHDQNWRILLHYAAMRGRVEVLEKLIVARPDSVQIVLNGNETVLHLCVKYNQLKALDLLVKSLSDDGIFSISKPLMMATLSCI